MFHKLMMYFTWWVNRKDAEANNAVVDATARGGFEEVLHSLTWLLRDRPDLSYLLDSLREPSKEGQLLGAFARDGRLERILRWLFDESEFLSPYGIRALSKVYEREPYVLREQNVEFRVAYEPAESSTGLFGGNSNWRGPVWMPVNYLVVHALRRMHDYYGDEYLVEFPTASGTRTRFGMPRTGSPNGSSRSSSAIADAASSSGASPRSKMTHSGATTSSSTNTSTPTTAQGSAQAISTGWTGLVANLIYELAAPREREDIRERLPPRSHPSP
jgi:hypothetical protein